VVSRPARITITWTALVAVLALCGCNGCERAPEAPAPVVKEGHLPQAPARDAGATPSVVIPPPSCAVVASSSVDEGTAPLTVQFSAEGMCTDATGVFAWNFGDGSAPSRDQNPTHVYAKPGTYTAKVTLADDEHNASDTDELPLTVAAP